MTNSPKRALQLCFLYFISNLMVMLLLFVSHKGTFDPKPSEWQTLTSPPQS